MALKYLPSEYIDNPPMLNDDPRKKLSKFLQDELGPGNPPWTWHQVVTIRNKITKIINDKSWH